MKAIGLLSGGLDSILAIKVLQEQGLEIEALNFHTLFCSCTPKGSSCSAAASAAKTLGVPLKVIATSDEFLEVVRRPKHGYGRNMNPCLDCRILKFSKAREYMLERGASFIFTGDVLGERPMSQNMEAMKLIERESGLAGLILRPLCAKLMEPTIPEINGWVDREKLLNIQGRSRKPQIAMAKDYGINDYPCPAGGCKLTEPNFANRLRDLMQHMPDFTKNDVQLLMTGRHFRLSGSTKAVMGRDANDNLKIMAYLKEGDIVMAVIDISGPTTLLRGADAEAWVEKAAIMTASFSKADGQDITVRISVTGGGRKEPVEMSVKPVSREMFDEVMLHQ